MQYKNTAIIVNENYQYVFFSVLYFGARFCNIFKTHAVERCYPFIQIPFKKAQPISVTL